MDVVSTGIGVLVAVVVLIGLGLLLVVGRMFRKVEQGKALIVSKVRRVDVTFTGTVVLPVLHKAEIKRAKAMVAAESIKAKLIAEAEGLQEKAGAMAALDDATREHEEFRLRLEMEKQVRLAGIEVHRQVAEAQAKVLAAGLEKADIDIVGGDSMFFDKLLGSITLGKSIDGFVESSTVAQAVGARYLDGNGDFAGDLSRALGSVSTADVANLSLAAFLTQQIKAGAGDAGKLRDLLAAAEKMGIADARIPAAR